MRRGRGRGEKNAIDRVSRRVPAGRAGGWRIFWERKNAGGRGPRRAERPERRARRARRPARAARAIDRAAFDPRAPPPNPARLDARHRRARNALSARSGALATTHLRIVPLRASDGSRELLELLNVHLVYLRVGIREGAESASARSAARRSSACAARDAAGEKDASRATPGCVRVLAVRHAPVMTCVVRGDGTRC